MVMFNTSNLQGKTDNSSWIKLSFLKTKIALKKKLFCLNKIKFAIHNFFL